MRVNILLSFSGNGGVEKMAVNLMHGFCELGCDVYLFRIKDRGEFAKKIPDRVNTIQLPFKHTFLNIPYMARYLRYNKIDSLLVMKERAGIMAIISKLISRSNTKVFIRFGTHITRSFEEKNLPKPYLKMRLFLLRKFLPFSDGIIGVSKGVVDDIISICPKIKNKTHVIKNPVITNELYRLSLEHIQEDWLDYPKKVPVVIAMGRLTLQKDFETLLKAISIVRKKMVVRLIILGEGELKGELIRLARKLGIEQDVKFLGFKKNPYPYLKKSDLFVLSSRWEGSPNSLTEAISLGSCVVSTDCESGPREILQDGKIGPLVKVGDYNMLAHKIIEVLKDPPDRDLLIESAKEYSYLKSAQDYLNLLKRG